MEHTCNKQYWLENVLKKLCKKAHSLEKVKPRSRQKKKLNVSVTNINSLQAYKNQKIKKCQEKEKSLKYQIVTRQTKQKNRERRLLEKHMKKNQSNHVKDKFWKFVDAFLESRSYLSRNKNAFFLPVIPSAINNTLLKSVGNTLPLQSRVISHHTSNKSALSGDYAEGGSTLTLRSRIISRGTSDKSSLPGDYEEEAFLRSEMCANGGRKALAQKILFTIQKARIKKATDVIAKEVLAERKAKKSLKKNNYYCI